jgi:guanylate kinase
MKKGILFIISSPSGGGKGTLIREILDTVPNVGYSISFTTRRARAGEEHGKHYFFVSSSEFENLIREGEFLEYARVHGNFYGTSRSQVEKELNYGRDIILEIDVQGATSIKQVMPESVSVFILPPSLEVLRERLKKRGSESEADFALRIKNSRGETERFREFEYIVINDDKETAARQLASIFYAERARLHRMENTALRILETFQGNE